MFVFPFCNDRARKPITKILNLVSGPWGSSLRLPEGRSGFKLESWWRIRTKADHSHEFCAAPGLLHLPCAFTESLINKGR